MPIRDRDDATQVANRFQRFFEAESEQRPGILRELFAEILDFDRESGRLSLVQAQGRVGVELPDVAERIAALDGVDVLYVDLSSADTATDRVRKAEVLATANVVRDALREDMLLLFSNRSGNQLHWIHPKFSGGATPTLRRIVLERGIEQRTAIQQFSNIYWSYRDSGNILDAVNEAFNVDKVTKDFFREYKRIFERAEELITGFSDPEERKQFVQTLFNRMMFVYFLSRKGWLKYEGKTDYLNTLWDAYADHATQDNFYNDHLTFLFFQGLNNPDSRDVRGGVDFLIGDVPFLNGGLFEETEIDRRGDITVPDEAIRPLMTELFDKFNFTVMESTPFDIEVAVDPEMLGKVFEELVTGRHDSGAYYTPRPVVSFMCREALKGYLETSLSAPSDPLSPRERVRAVPVDATGALTPALSQGEREPMDDTLSRFVDDHDASGLSISQAEQIRDALSKVTVVDPACGSGAYLVGMMQELVDLRVELYNQKLRQDARSLYELKLHIIERNLHGVDLDPFAVNIAMLRLWLSLAIEYEGEQPEPLPNLDFKIVEGDSLLGPDPSEVNQSAYLISQTDLANDKAAYMRETDPYQKKRLDEQVREQQSQLREAMGDIVSAGALDWRIDFAEIIADGGFDIVLANPPYVVVKSDELRTLYREGVFGRMNTYGLFLQRSLQLLTEDGQLVFINPRTLLTDKYFINLRDVIRRQSELRGVVLIEDRHRTFDRVLQECVVFHTARKAEPATQYTVRNRAISLPEELNDHYASFSVDASKVLLGGSYARSFYVGPSDFHYDVFERMDRVGTQLASLGLKAETGKVQFDKFATFALPSLLPEASRLIWAENIQRYCVRPSQKRIGKEFLSSAISDAIAPSITGIGIATQRVTANEQPRRIIATLVEPMADSIGTYSENHTNYIPLEDDQITIAEFILAALNSSAMEFVFRRLNSNTQVSAGEINTLPFPPLPNQAMLEEIAELVSELVDLGGVDSAKDSVMKAIEIEQRLDILIGSLYGLSEADIQELWVHLSPYSQVYGLSEEEIAAVEARVSGQTR